MEKSQTDTWKFSQGENNGIIQNGGFERKGQGTENKTRELYSLHAFLHDRSFHYSIHRDTFQTSGVETRSWKFKMNKIVKNLHTTKRKYDIIYADPAWRFGDAKTGGNHKSGASQKYLTLSFQEICDLPVNRITNNDAVLFLWIPDSMLIEGLKVFDNWGFKYKKKGFTWIKKTKHNMDFFGMGRSTRNGSEDLYLGIKGRPKFISKSIRQVQYAKIEEHSRKPELFRKLILDLCGKKKRIELFARKSCCGFDVWGNEIS